MELAPNDMKMLEEFCIETKQTKQDAVPYLLYFYNEEKKKIDQQE